MLPNQNDHLSWAHTLVHDWFIDKFGSPSEPQIQGWPSILSGNPTLISAPTGSGKTLAAFLICIDRLIRESLNGQLKNETQILYISPLKALSNDIQKNLSGPLGEISQLAKARGLPIPEISVAVRTGDTTVKDRQKMLKKPPHILVTTPESLYILLTAEKSRAILSTVKTVIVDEIHALANDKRGSHLSLSLERLESVCVTSPLRIGLSATQKPIELIAFFLTGSHRVPPVIVNVGHTKQLELAIEIPKMELGAVASNEMWDEIYNRIAELVQQNRSTLVFVNTRRLAERVAHHLTERLGADQVATHHGSLSHKLRLAAETKLKQGELKVLVATASLELGIDIGTVDLVCQIGSPRAISVMLQRVGRAGHWLGAISKGRLFATTRDELLECAALINAIKEGDLDKVLIPEQPLDILSQQIVAACATKEWFEDELYTLIIKSCPYSHLSRSTFNSLIEMLSEGIAGSRGRYGAYLHRDQINGIVKGRRGSRLAAIMSGGAIPENGLFSVITVPDNITVGTLDEDFAVESSRGDIILLGTTSWKINRVESVSGKVFVEDAHGAPPSVPFWRGEAPARTIELSIRVSNLRETLNNMLVSFPHEDNIHSNSKIASILEWLHDKCGLNNFSAQQLIKYIIQGRNILGNVPTQKTLIAERFFDETGGMQLVIHAPFGARINKAWGLALRKRFCRSFNFELQAAATDNGLNISLTEQHSFPLSDVFHFLNSKTIKEVLVQAVLQSPLFTTRWRWTATRSLAVLRYRNGKKIPPNILRMLSDDLLAAVFPDAAACQDNLAGRDIELPDHPLINEAIKDALTNALDVDGLIAMLKNIENGHLQCIAIDTLVPSVFSHEILNANPYAYLDDAPLEERRSRAVEMRHILPESLLNEIGRLDPFAIEEIQQQAWPDIRNSDELHDALQTFISLPEEIYLNKDQKVLPSWKIFLELLIMKGRAATAMINGKKYWFAAEKAKYFSLLYSQVTLSDQMKGIESKILSREDIILNLIRGWMLHIGPTTSQELSDLLQLDLLEINQALLKLESAGFILRGNFRYLEKNQIEWCERRLLARIHKLTILKLRKEIKPVNASEFVHWLLDWQHLSKGTQLRGKEGLLEVIQQLQGFELPANAWEKQIFIKRIVDYHPDMLDHLCLTGIIGWGRFSAHPAILKVSEFSLTNDVRQISPTSNVPIAFFLRENPIWIPQNVPLNEDGEQLGISHLAKKIYTSLKESGASFFVDIVQKVGGLKVEVEMALWELVAAGMITADGFDNLRALIDPKRRLGKRGYRNISQQGTGRWSLLQTFKLEHESQSLDDFCWILLKRYGIVFRDLLIREKLIPFWRDLLKTFRRLEDRGEIRGGRFVSGFIGEQFALPYAVESLRSSRKRILTNDPVTISGVDPLNLVGIILPGQRIPALSKTKINLKNGNVI